MGRTTWIVLLALTGGIGVGYLLGRRDDTPERRERPAVTVLDERAPVAGLEEAARRIEIPQVDSGTGELRGRVTREDGEPFEGVLVVATRRESSSRWRHRVGEAAPREPTIEDLVREQKTRLAARRQARSGPDGSYRISGLADREYRVRAHAAGMRFRAIRSGRSSYARPGETIDFQAVEIRKLNVDVLAPDGSRPMHARIHAKGGTERSVSESWYRDEPWIWVRPRRYVMHARDQDQRKSEEVEVDARTDPGPLVFRLKGRPGVRGLIVMPDGCDAVNGASVYAMRYIQGRPPTPKELAKSTKRFSTGGLDVRASYRLTDLVPGTYVLGLSLDRWHEENPEFVLTETVEIGDDEREHDLRIPAPDPREFFDLRVVDPGGNPVRMLKLHVYFRAPEGGWGRTPKFFLRSNGSFLVQRPPPESRNGKFTVEVASRPWGRAEIPFDRERGTELTHRFESPAYVELTLSNVADHAGPWNGRVELRSGQHGHSGRTNGPVDESGKRRYGPFQPGEYDLILSMDRRATVAVRPLTLRPSEIRRVEMLIPDLHELTVRVTKKEAVTWLQLQRKSHGRHWRRFHASFHDKTEHTFESLAPGTYEIQYYTVDGQTKRVEFILPGTRELVLP